MPDTDDKELNPERVHTDDSLRAERDKADAGLGDEGLASEELANAVLAKARRRADLVLAATRLKLDRQPSMRLLGAQARQTIEQERQVADLALHEERATADKKLRREREASAALLVSEREETDKDLSVERALADGALATRDEFLGIVSHDLRNMLSTMAGFSKLILDEQASPAPRPAKVLGYAQTIHRATGRMDRLVGDLLDVASIQAGTLVVNRELGELAPVVAEAVDAFQAHALASGVALTVSERASVPPVLFDAARVLQLLVNLLGNAFKFTPRGGAVAVAIEQLTHEILLSVRDTGQGIASQDLEAIFGRYLQVSPDRRGVGLGLYISRCIANGHGGRIWAESTMGQGSTFFFALPLPGAAAPPPPAA